MEIALLFPMLLALTLAGVQVAFWYHGRSLCHAAADTGARAARADAAPAGAGITAATGYLARTAGGSLTDSAVTESRTATAVTVGCAGTVPRVVPLPGLELRVTQRVSAPRERFTTP